jgi:MSHA biogenesis protein MshJ
MLAGLVGVIGLLWMVLVHDPLVAAKATAARNITIAEGLIVEEQNRQEQIRSTYTSDPNNFAVTRQRELRDAATTANTRLNELYGELISPQQMSQMLTTILQRDTSLKLISLENQPSEALIDAAVAPEGGVGLGVQVFRHGLRMVFQGNYLETIRYLRSLEQLDGNFFWDNLEFNLTTYPDGEISLDIYTLSTERGWIGV